MKGNSKKVDFCIDDYRYLNTADILLLNAVANLQQRRIELDLPKEHIDKTIRMAIFLTRDAIQEALKKQNNTATLTRTSKVFQNVREKIEKITSNEIEIMKKSL